MGDLGRFRSFLRAIAARTGQLLNLSDIARDLGVAVNTGKAWLSILEATYQVVIVRGRTWGSGVVRGIWCIPGKGDFRWGPE